MKTSLHNSAVLVLLLCLSFFSEKAQAQCTITGTTVSVNNLNLTCGTAPLNACNGILYIGDGITPTTLIMDKALNLSCLGTIQLIIRNQATISFSTGNDYLTLAAGSSITILPGGSLNTGSDPCAASERIYIGTNLFASCNGNAGADVSFATLVALGGTGSAACNSPVCVGSTISLTAVHPPNGTYTYSWSGPGLAATAYSSSPNYSVTATTSGTYQVLMRSSLAGNPTSVAETLFTVTALPSSPTIGTITQPTCTSSTGNVVVNGLPASGTWILTRSGTSSGITSGTGTSTTIFGLSLGTYTFQVDNGTCTSLASAGVTITPALSSIWNGSSWSTAPSITRNVVFSGNYSANANIDACSCQVTSGAVVIKPGYYLNVSKAVTVLGGSLTIDDNASLIQTDDSAVNFGNIIVNRSVYVKKFDYVYWSSPVANFPLVGISPTTSTNHLWKWTPTISGNHGGWVNANENMTKAKGYIVRGPSVYDNITAQKHVAAFSGVPSNGVLTATVERGSYEGADISNGPNQAAITNKDDNYNLIGNPYASAIKATDFLSLNTNLEGTIRLWTHGTLPSAAAQNPFYGSFVYNYTMNDYIVYNSTGTISGPAGFNGLIASGQGFFVAMNDGPAISETVTFNNAMRSKTYANTQFYKNSNTAGTNDSAKIWLDLVGGNGSVNRTLIGYIEGATYAKDRLYDSYIKLDNSQNLYSLISGEKVCIQGRPLPFTADDAVQLGFQSPNAAGYKIAIAAVEGLFENSDQPIYLKDNQLEILHDLRLAPYTFATEAGTFNERFTLVYGNTLAAAGFENKGSVEVTNKSGQINIKSFAGRIQSVTIYDIPGREIFNKPNVNDSKLEISSLSPTKQVLILKIGLENGQNITKKTGY
jgi:hypothetical protein